MAYSLENLNELTLYAANGQESRENDFFYY